MTDDAEDRFDDIEPEPQAGADEPMSAADEDDFDERDFDLIDLVSEAPLRPRLEHELEQEFFATRRWVVFVAGGWFLILGANLAFVVWQTYALRDRMTWYMMVDLVTALVWEILLLVGVYLLALFGQRCRSFLRSRSNLTLESALAAQKSFWKYCAILGVINLALALVVVAVLAVLFMRGLPAPG